jgi:outer membrane biosynthesis protein TonB
MSVSYSQKDFEKKNQLKALVITVLINTILFLLIWQVKIWNESPTPKLPDINEAAAGEISFEQEPPAPMPQAQQEVTQTTEPEQTNTVPPLTSDVESPVTVKKTPAIVNKEIKEAEPVIDLNLTMGKRSPRASTGGSGSATGTGSGTGSGSSGGISGGNGKGTGTGNGEGKIAQDWTFDSKSLYGIDNGNETGEITFFIRINENGNVIEIRIDRSNVKLTLAERYKKLIKNARFSPKNDGIRAGGASGYKTIKIKATN